jgi:hypothetical protein
MLETVGLEGNRQAERAPLNGRSFLFLHPSIISQYYLRFYTLAAEAGAFFAIDFEVVETIGLFLLCLL